MQFLTKIVEFLKRHYEKIILCAVLLGLAAVAVVMSGKISETKGGEATPPAPTRGKPIPPTDLEPEKKALQQITNPPPVVLNGDHNLFNPVTWKREPTGHFLKILRSGPDALVLTSTTPLYTIISYDHSTGTAGIYVFMVQTNSGRRMTEHPKLNEKTRSGLYIIRGTKGAAADPDELDLEIVDTQQHVTVTKTTPYKQVDGYTADMKYPPENRTLTRVRVNDTITLDGDPYKVIEITNNAARVQSIKTTKVTTIKATGNP